MTTKPTPTPDELSWDPTSGDLVPTLPRPQLTRQLAAHYLALSVLLDSVDQLTTPQGVLDALHDARESVWSGLEIAKAQGS